MSDEDGLKTITLPVEGMSCDHCVSAIRQALEGREGIDYVQVTLGRVEVRFQAYLTSDETIQAVIEGLGYKIAEREIGKRKGFIQRMIESNEKNFGNKRLDCCNVSSSQTVPQERG